MADHRDAPQAPGDVLIRAENGDVITFDATGLTLRLSDTVLADLRTRLAVPLDPAAVLGDIDAWGLRAEGNWHRFTARLEDGPRAYQRPVTGGNIIADAPGPLLGLFSIGGAQRAACDDAAPAFRFNVVAPGDDIGAVGWEGTGAAQATPALQQVPHATRDTLLADVLLGWRHDARRGLPLILTRAETDGAAGVAALGQGRAMANLCAALDSLCAAAASLGKPARVLAVSLDYALEDVATAPDAFAAGICTLMDAISAACAARGLSAPAYLAPFDSGLSGLHPTLAGQWALAWSHRPHLFAQAAPGYMHPRCRFGRLTAGGRARAAEMDAHALVALSARAPWTCPLFLLAETSGATIRVTAQAMADLVIDTGDPFGAGPGCGFALHGAGAAQITSVAVAPDDPRALLVTCDRPPEGAAPRLRYACGLPVNMGALRDAWTADARNGGPPLHRWAYPADLPLHPAGRA